MTLIDVKLFKAIKGHVSYYYFNLCFVISVMCIGVL